MFKIMTSASDKKNIMTIANVIEWESFTFTRYSPPQESWKCPTPPWLDSKSYNEEQAKQHLQYHSKDRLILSVEIKKI